MLSAVPHHLAAIRYRTADEVLAGRSHRRVGQARIAAFLEYSHALRALKSERVKAIARGYHPGYDAEPA